MIKDYNYIEVTCDICGCSKQVKSKEKLNEALNREFLEIKLPVTTYKNRYYTEPFVICQKCAEKFYANISGKYEIVCPDWGTPTIKGR